MQASTFRIRIRRQDRPGTAPYWETFELPYEPGLNITSCLQRIAARPITTHNREVAPVAYEAACLEEVCGSCTMIINGRVRQACSALVDHLLADGQREITLEPMSKFPVIRDLVVDRSPMFAALKRVRAWIPVDGYYDAGPGPIIGPREQEQGYALARCMTCGCCVEACPQYGPHNDFIGPAAIAQAVLFNSHPTGRLTADQRLEALMAPGGIADCGNAQNCVKVCPKDIPLTRAIARAGWETTRYAIVRFFTQ